MPSYSGSWLQLFDSNQEKKLNKNPVIYNITDFLFSNYLGHLWQIFFRLGLAWPVLLKPPAYILLSEKIKGTFEK